MSQSVSDCLSIDAVLSAQPLTVRPKEVKGLRLAVAKTIMQDALEPAVAKTFERTLDSLSASGAQIVEIDLKELQEISQINAPGGLSPIESYSAYSHFVDHKSEQMDHRVVKRMLMGKGVTAQQYLKILDARRDWISRVERALNSFDALISPTVPIQAPLTQSLLDSDDEFFRVNGLLLRNTFAINFLDGCAFSIPMHQAGELPMGLMISGCRGDDAHIASVSLAVESLLNRHR
jgi:aspartyl-tRNA(Asn)/glutamyl-tRNA(Gln) amidotransferase subunit A